MIWMESVDAGSTIAKDRRECDEGGLQAFFFTVVWMAKSEELPTGNLLQSLLQVKNSERWDNVTGLTAQRDVLDLRYQRCLANTRPMCSSQINRQSNVGGTANQIAKCSRTQSY